MRPLLAWIALLAAATPSPSPPPTNFWFQSQGRRDSTNMHNVTLRAIVGLLNETNTVTLSLRDGLVHVRVVTH